MQTLAVGTSSLRVSRLAYGCWRLGATPERRADDKRAVITAVESGFTLFDHADIYALGEAEKIFGEVLRENPGMRERVTLVTKAGVRRPDDPPGSPYHYNLSGEHLVRCCEGSLRRLGVETIDLFLLHRADWLTDPVDVAAAFSRLQQAGKVRFFGVSNCRPSLVSALQAACPMPLVAQQVEISLGQLAAFEDGTLDQCLEMKLTPLAWSPLGGGQFADGAKRLLKYQEGYRTAEVLPRLDEYAKTRGVTRSAVALAWLLKHPSGIIPIVGSTRPERIRDAARAPDIDLSREEWYHLLNAARREPLP
ncbi:MAG TPA: aldo/keto reductase [Candidatus Acidoferrum sp.]|nr:aldo/keto reductase [Candidatus Acidoferrum sp.]